MLNVRNRLRILGSDHEVTEVKAFLDASKGDQKKPFDLSKIASGFKGEIADVHIAYDTIEFRSDREVTDQIIELSKRFGDVKFGYQMILENKTSKEGYTMVEEAKAHYVIFDGMIVSESKSSSKMSRAIKDETKKIETKDEKKAEPSKQHDLITKDSLYDLQEKFFKDVQEFMKDFTKSFFDHWF